MIAVFNECTILVCGYHLLLLTDYIEEDYQHYNAGWSLVGVTVLNLVVNLAVVVYDMLGQLGDYIAENCYKKKQQKPKVN